jgi:CheY-like chemotaxis protein
VRLLDEQDIPVEHPVWRSVVGDDVRLEGRVLLAEDNPVNQKLVTRILEKVGAEVTVAGDGQPAVDSAVGAQTRGDPFDVVLMDMQMPVLDGYSAVRLLREQGYGLPIIAVTANSMSSDREQCFQAGCDEFATKPINKRELLGTIHDVIQGSRVTAESRGS